MSTQGSAESDVRVLTREEARAVPLPGWNIRCQRCGTYGALWRSSYVRPRGNHLRLCEGCDDARILAWRHLREAERVAVAQSATDQRLSEGEGGGDGHG